jgi:hypothetical protein
LKSLETGIVPVNGHSRPLQILSIKTTKKKRYRGLLDTPETLTSPIILMAWHRYIDKRLRD